MEIGAVVTMALFALGLIFQAGRLVNRLDTLEARIAEVKQDVDELRGEVRALYERRARQRGD